MYKSTTVILYLWLWVGVYTDMAAIPPPMAYSNDQPSSSSSSSANPGGNQDNSEESGYSYMQHMFSATPTFHYSYSHIIKFTAEEGS